MAQKLIIPGMICLNDATMLWYTKKKCHTSASPIWVLLTLCQNISDEITPTSTPWPSQPRSKGRNERNEVSSEQRRSSCHLTSRRKRQSMQADEEEPRRRRRRSRSTSRFFGEGFLSLLSALVLVAVLLLLATAFS